MKKLVYIFLLLTVSSALFSQSFDDLMQSIEQNNPRLQTLQKWLEAEEVYSKTGVYPNNPTVSYNYLFGNPDNIGDQKEFEIIQSFQLPGYYTSKADLQKLGFQQKQALAEKEKRDIMHAARTLYFNLVWLQKRVEFLEKRNSEAATLVTLMKEGLDGGEVSKPAYDKARIYAIRVKNQWQQTMSELSIYTEQLKQQNGGLGIDNQEYKYPVDWALPQLDSLLLNLADTNPDLVMAQLKLHEAETNIKNSRMESWPSFELGYKSETILNQKLQGIHAGLSIPLWQNKNAVKYAKLQTEWSMVNLNQQESEYKTKASTLYSEVVTLKNSYEEMKVIMDEQQLSESNLELLKSGQISFSEYLVDADLIWDSQSQYLSYEHDYFKCLSQLKMME
ncbi:TolC family protein [Carboxylicivirga sp. A043]|uniref:TolC family protein n=1 Tax=Carboxylicivirga litoralis TaxID=2816963 RepID=UPI0021CB02D0|nr:TolC family protein [Carboxylicivirga sp. A043]MCU4156124.1 TolC family protein [Carboxylicivirga sp. A043]